MSGPEKRQLWSRNGVTGNWSTHRFRNQAERRFLAVTAHTANDPEPAFAGDGIGNQKSETGTIRGNIGSSSVTRSPADRRTAIPERTLGHALLPALAPPG